MEDNIKIEPNKVIAREYVEKNYIHKDKIKQKIQEIKDSTKQLSKFSDWKHEEYTNEDVIISCIETLKELLEG